LKEIVLKNKKELDKYRSRLFEAKEAYRKEQAELPFEKKIEMVNTLNRFAKQWRNS